MLGWAGMAGLNARGCWCSRRVVALGLVLVGLWGAVMFARAASAGAAVRETPLSGPQAFGQWFNQPAGVASDRTHVWALTSTGIR